MSGKRRAIVGAALLVAVLAGCSTPVTGPGTLADSKLRIVGLVNETAREIGSPVVYKAAPASDALPCRRHFLGYTIKRLATHRAEVTDPIAFKGSKDGASLLPHVEAYWRSQGWVIDRSGLSDRHYPKIRTHVGGDLLVATGYVGHPQINLYGVTECVNS